MKPNHVDFIEKKWLRQILLLMGLGLFSNPLFAGTDTGADFLKIPIGAEPAALGQAYTALAHGINALNWNPAGIVQTPNSLSNPLMGLSISHQDQLEENNLDHLGLIIPGGNRHRDSWGVDFIRLSYADQVRRDAERQTLGNISSSDMAFGAAYAHNFGEMQFGTQLKIIRQELADAQADGFAVDLGFLSATTNPRLTVGFSARNLGPQMRFIDEKFSLPLTLSFGSAYRLANPLVVAMDIHYKPHQRQTVVALGTQLFATSNISLRAGYLAKIAETVTNNQKYETTRGNLMGIDGITGGFGFQFKQFSLDYSITPFGELGNSQMLTLSTWLGENIEKKDFGDTEELTPPSDRLILILPLNNEFWWERLK